MKLPGAKNAVVEIEKLRGYCLSTTHPRGRHKARVFLSALGMTEAHAEELRELLLQAALTNEAILSSEDRFGARYRIDVPLTRSGRQSIIRSYWIVRGGERVPRLVSCFVI